MERSVAKQVAGDMEDLRSRIGLWRRTRPSSRSRMPAPLWREAVALCDEHTIHAVSQRLGVGYDRLRRRVVEAELERLRAETPTEVPEFVELHVAPEPPEESISCSVHEVEVVRTDGARLILRAEAPLDVHGLTRTFLEQGP